LLIFQRDISGPRLGALSNNRWSEGISDFRTTICTLLSSPNSNKDLRSKLSQNGQVKLTTSTSVVYENPHPPRSRAYLFLAKFSTGTFSARRPGVVYSRWPFVLGWLSMHVPSIKLSSYTRPASVSPFSVRTARKLRIFIKTNSVTTFCAESWKSTTTHTVVYDMSGWMSLAIWESKLVWLAVQWSLEMFVPVSKPAEYPPPPPSSFGRGYKCPKGWRSCPTESRRSAPAGRLGYKVYDLREAWWKVAFSLLSWGFLDL
jgi:hypothetical protein